MSSMIICSCYTNCCIGVPTSTQFSDRAVVKVLYSERRATPVYTEDVTAFNGSKCIYRFGFHGGGLLCIVVIFPPADRFESLIRCIRQAELH